MTRDIRDERGATAVVTVVTLIALFGAGMLSVDAGSLWHSRRHVIRATDAAALDAANYFATGLGDPCASEDQLDAEDRATAVFEQNAPDGLHDVTNTPDGFEVTVEGSCDSGSIAAGKVRFDGRLFARQTFSGIFDFDDINAFASSTAAWGYVSEIAEGLRPIAICDQATAFTDDPLVFPPTGPYPHYELWNRLNSDDIDQATYDSYYGAVATEYPTSSTEYTAGENNRNPNRNRTYPAPDGTGARSTVHRITMPDASCGVASGNRVWVDFTGPGSGTIGSSTLRQWILDGYPGSVSLDPHDCTPSNSVSPENCGAKPGDTAGVSRALGTITCPVETLARECDYVFPVPVIESVSEPGANAEYDHVAFLFVVLRGFGSLSTDSLQFDFEFLNVQTSGKVSGTNPYGSHTPVMGTHLCGIDNDDGDRCF